MLFNFVKIILLPAIITRELEHVMSNAPKSLLGDLNTDLTI
jgi:hypothetical protein